MTIFSDVAAAATRQQASILDLLARQTSLCPEAIAVRTKSKQLTYLELNEQARRFAAGLIQAGVQPGALIGVFMDRSPECLAALLGIWKVGAAYLAVDPISPPERLTFVLQDAQVSLVIADRKLASLLPPDSPSRLYTDDLLSGPPPDGAESAVSISPDDLAYVLYTSGSTGKPKGVEICHYSLANVITAVAEELQLHAEDVLLAHTSLGFDVSNLELYLPLVSGGSLYVAEPGRVGDGARLIRALKESRATAMLGTCTLWRLLLDAGWEGKSDLRVISGGEVLPMELARTLVQRTAALWNHYGPTEATISATTARIDATTDRVTIGRPISNVTVHILDANLQPVLEETAGELYIGGTGVARAYRNRPDLTKASFLPDPFSAKPGARLYKTGDLARKLADGRLEFLGRIDQQVKIHGYRIELEEIEEQIRQFPEINAAAVTAVGRGQADQRLVAWVESKQAITPSLLREFLRRRLPSYMVPSEFRRLQAIPLNESGKIDRKALDSLSAPIAENPAGSETDLEARLRSIWEELLQVKPIALTDSFFDLGGDSLLAALLVTQIKTHLGKTITPDMLIECPAIKSLAARISTQENQPLRTLTPLRAEGVQPPLFSVHGLGGSALLFRALLPFLAGDQPVYGVMLPSGVVQDRAEMEIKAVAAKCLEEIRRTFPSGPYHLAGHSFGALVALEMAAQLKQSGQDIGLLAFIDGDLHLARQAAYDEPATPTLVLRRYQAKLKSLTEKGISEVFRRRVEYMKLRKRMKLAKKAAEDDSATGNFEATELMALAAKDYNPRPYMGSAVLFRSKDVVRSKADRDLGWAELVRGGLEIVDIPGGHLTVFDEPNVSALAAALTERLSPVLCKA